MWTRQGVLAKVKPEPPLEAKMTKLEAVLRWAHHEKAGSLEKAVMLGKIEGSRKRGGPAVTWIDFIKEAIGGSLQQPSRAVRRGQRGPHAFTGSPGLGDDSTACDTHTQLCRC